MLLLEVSLRKVEKLQQTLSHLRFEYWKEHVVFSFQWWFLLAALFLSIYLAYRYFDRSRFTAILLFLFITFSIVAFLDIFGAELNLWEYPAMVVPWGTRNLCIDMMMSIFYTLIYQRFSNWSPFIIASAVLAAVYTFVFEPIAIWLHIYMPNKWEIIYSLPIYFLISIFVKWIVECALGIEARSKRNAS
jgi:hypothetical protein